MNTHAERSDFLPPEERRWGMPLLLAMLAHGLLVVALTWGVSWKSESEPVVMEAELWTRLPQVAAPRAVEPEPEPVKPQAEPEPPVPPAPETPPPSKPATPPGPTEAEIALQKQAEARKAEEEQRRLEQARKREELRQKEEQRKREAAKQEEARKKEATRLAEEKKKREAELKQKQEAARKSEEARRSAQLEADRKKNLERMLGQAGASGAPKSTGTAQQSGGPSATYGGKVVGAIRPNIVFTESAPGNPRAEVEVRTLPDGTIIGRRLTQSSGHNGWDEAVLRAIDRTAKLPKDENGRVPSSLTLGFRPQE